MTSGKRKKQASNGFLHNGFAERMFNDNSRLIVRALTSFPRGKVQMLPSAKITQLKELLASLRSYGISTFEAEVNCMGKTENRDFLEILVDALYEVDTYITVSSAPAIQKYLVEFTKAEGHIFLLRELLKGIREGKNPGLIMFLIVVHNYFYLNHQELPGYILKSIEQALICVEKRTAYSGGDSEKELKQKVEIRCQGAALAFQLYLYEKSWKNGQHSTASLLWRDICCGIKAEDEFVEVRNVWIELP